MSEVVAGPGEGLSVDAMVERAAALAGGGGNFDPGTVVNLRPLVDSCRRTANLTPTGAEVLRKVAVRHLLNGLYVRAWLDRYPEQGRLRLPPPVVITGLPRTGTTLLHNLMSLDPSRRVLRLWQALHPVPPDPDGRFSEQSLVAQATSWLARLYELSPGFRAIHPASPHGPEECDALMQNTFASQHFDDMFDAAAYSEWLNNSALVDEYALYGDQLRVLTPPSDPDRVWVMKSPSHLGHLEGLRAAFPEATVVHCHRHPLETVPSYASLMMAVRSPYTEAVSPAEVGRQALSRAALAMTRALDLRRAGDEGFVDVSYPALVSDPLGVVAGIYQRLGWDLDPGLRAAMGQWLAANRQHQYGIHHYDASMFDLPAARVLDAFGPYLEDFADHVRG